MWDSILDLVRKYMGTGLIVICFFICLIYLYLKERRRPVRILFLYMPVCVLFLFFNPLFAQLIMRVVGDEIYYRILWLLPVTVVTAYVCVSVCRQSAESCTQKKKKGCAAICAVCMAGTIVVSGNFIYSSPVFSAAENMYHVPDSVVHICDAICVPGREVMAVFPLDMVQYVRQYTPYVCMPYGREMVVERWGFYSALCEQMEADVIMMEELVPLVREEKCHFCILHADKKINGNPEEYGWVRIGETDGYVIYRDMAAELVIPDLSAGQSDF